MEIWKNIEGYEDYKVSNLGNVKSLKFGKEKMLKPNINSRGYLKVTLSKKNNKKTYNIHKLVAISFLNHKPNGYELVVNHINFIRDDNRLENLEIVTQRENSNKKHISSTSKYLGVCWSKRANKWISSFGINGKSKSLGYFDTEIEASQYYEKALKNYNLGLPIEVKKPNFSSKYKGVNWNIRRNKWRSYITINRKQNHLGYFNTEIEASNAYQNALKNLT